MANSGQWAMSGSKKAKRPLGSLAEWPLRRTAGVLRFRSSCARLGRPLGLRCDDHHKKAFSPPEAAIASSREHDAVATVLIIGASRGIGLEAVKAALEAGHSVRALVPVSPNDAC